ncbi:NXPE family member 1-like [Mytilus californianus]|uniref:NXPE family member 1-like n=1 Tax=Mytilus californianus TaxID=6549 RepID=UPI002245D874|nr:NXPE family member 1-like [Mytilus californianus]
MKLFGYQFGYFGYKKEIGTFTTTDFKYYKRYMSFENVEFGKSLVYLPKSTVEIYNNKSATFTTGDIITLRIILHNENGDVVTDGGEFIKIWMSEKGKGAGSVGYVVDHGNGTYIGVIKALWSGSPHITLLLPFPRESIGLFVNHIYRNGMLRTLKGVFKNARGETGKGICGIHTLTKDGICDFTSLNYGMRWFCSLPDTAGFTCTDWYAPIGDPTISTLSKTQKHFLSSTSNRIIKEIKVHVYGDKTIYPPKCLCREINPSVTWNSSSPMGYFYNRTWHNLLCQNKVEHSNNMYISCLKNRELYMVGDSTLRQWLMSMVEILNLKLSVGRTSDALRGYHQPIKALSKNKRHNICVTWAAHEFPFFTYKPNTTIHHFKPARYHLKVIRSKNPIVVLPWYVHIGFAPLSVYEEHVRNAKDAIIQLLNRVPSAKILSVTLHNIKNYEGVPYDFVRYLQDKLLFQIFNNIKHKVVYLNEWDITVASESNNMHPVNELSLKMVHELLSYIC